MPDFADIINKINDVVNEADDINDFIFDERNSINWKDRSTSYPKLLIDASNIPMEVLKFQKSTQLPIQVSYELSLFFYETFTEADKKTATMQARMNSLFTKSNQFIGYLAGQLLNTPLLGFWIGKTTPIRISVRHDIHNDRLIEAQFQIIIIANDIICDTGNFTP